MSEEQKITEENKQENVEGEQINNDQLEAEK